MSLGLADELPRQKAEQYAGMAKTPAHAVVSALQSSILTPKKITFCHQ